MQGVGQKRYLDIINRLEEFSIRLKEAELSKFEVGEIYEYVKDLKISDVVIPLKIEDTHFSDTNTKLSELVGKRLDELKHISDTSYLTELSNELSRLQIPKDSLLNFKSQLKDNQQSVLKMRVFEEKTLEEVGQKLKVTRERVRQIESNMKQKINVLFSSERLNESLILISGNLKYITSRELLGILGEENKDIINGPMSRNWTA